MQETNCWSFGRSSPVAMLPRREELDVCSDPASKRSPTLPKSTCVICLESLFLPDQHIGTATPCGHCFHLDCLRRWKAENIGERRASRCPLCNKIIDSCGKIFLHLTEDEEETLVDELCQDKLDSDRVDRDRRSSEVVAKLVDRVMWAKKDKCVLESLQMLTGMAADGQRACTNLALAGCIPAAVRAVREFRESKPAITMQACVLLGDLAQQDTTGRLRATIVRTGIIQAMLMLTQHYLSDPKCLTVILWTMATLAEAPDRNVKGADVRSAVVAQAQQIKTVLVLMRLHLMYPRLQVHGCRALSNLTAFSENAPRSDTIDVFAKNKGIPTVLTAMERNPSDSDLQFNGCRLLQTVCNESPSNAKTVWKQGGIELLVKIVENNPKQAEVRHAAVCLLSTIHDLYGGSIRKSMQRKGVNKVALVA